MALPQLDSTLKLSHNYFAVNDVLTVKVKIQLSSSPQPHQSSKKVQKAFSVSPSPLLGLFGLELGWTGLGLGLGGLGD